VLKEAGGSGGLLSKVKSLMTRRNRDKKQEETIAADTSVKAKSE